MMENPVSILLIHITVRKSGCNHHLAVCQKCKIASLRVLKAQLVNITIKINTELILRILTVDQSAFALFYRIISQTQFYKTDRHALQFPAFLAVSGKGRNCLVGCDFIAVFIPGKLPENLKPRYRSRHCFTVRMLCILHVALQLRIDVEAVNRQKIPVSRIASRHPVIINTPAYLDACACAAERITVCLHLCTDMKPGISCFLIINGGKRRAVQCNLCAVLIYGVVTAVRIERLADVIKRLIPGADSPCNLCIFQSVYFLGI